MVRSLRPICLLFLMPSCTHHSRIARKKVTITYPLNTGIDTVRIKTNENPPPITIWIHGTRLFRRPIFHTEFNSKPSLKKVHDITHDTYLSKLAHALYHSDPIQYPIDTFYVFGWSGRLSMQDREDASEQLHMELEKIIINYQKIYGIYPIIQMICHSHGGNVALNLVKTKSANCALEINRLVLLAVPVQELTVEYIRDSMFKKVYALYSGIDMIQVLAPEVIYKTKRDKYGNVTKKRVIKIPPFSARHFPSQSNLIQAKVKINGHAILHTEFSSSRFAEILPHLIPELDAWHQEELANITLEKKDKFLCIYKKHAHRRGGPKKLTAVA